MNPLIIRGFFTDLLPAQENKLIMTTNNLFKEIEKAFELSIEIDIDKYLPVNIARQLEEVIDKYIDRYSIKKDKEMIDNISYQLMGQLNNVLKGSCN
jgi:hypothetical protein